MKTDEQKEEKGLAIQGICLLIGLLIVLGSFGTLFLTVLLTLLKSSVDMGSILFVVWFPLSILGLFILVVNKSHQQSGQRI